jgi:hypothetical protein
LCQPKISAAITRYRNELHLTPPLDISLIPIGEIHHKNIFSTRILSTGLV